jgi:plastocyanin
MVSASFIAAALSTFPLAFAYYPAPNGTTTLTPQPSGTGVSKPVHTVAVGQNGLTFTPDTVHANVGDDVVFQFFPKNHTVVQADFNNPCNPSQNGIFSGFNFNVTNGTAVSSTKWALCCTKLLLIDSQDKTFTITVSDTKPVWLYCSQNQPKPHCAAGMVAVINPPASGPNTLDAFKAAAAKTTVSTSPAGGASGGQVGAPGSGSGSPSSPNSPSGTSTGPAQSTGAASSLTISGALGVAAIFAGIAL